MAVLRLNRLLRVARTSSPTLAPLVQRRPSARLRVRGVKPRLQSHPHGGQFDFDWIPARTPHGGASYER